MMLNKCMEISTTLRRDAWFEVPLPFFLRDQVSGLGWDPKLTGAFLAIFIIVYGQVQSWSPHLLLTPLKQAPANKYVALLWAGILLFVPGCLGPIILGSDAFSNRNTDAMTGILVVRICMPLHGLCVGFDHPVKQLRCSESLPSSSVVQRYDCAVAW